MTNEEALKIAKSTNALMHGCNGGKKGEYVELIIEALEKQIPKKVVDSFVVTPVYGDDGEQVDVLFEDEFKCPCCGWVIARGVDNKSYFEGVNYCDSCGQALDWSEEESND